jgi:hypothetical protein
MRSECGGEVEEQTDLLEGGEGAPAAPFEDRFVPEVAGDVNYRPLKPATRSSLLQAQ